MEESTRVLLVPIFRRYFLWHAWGGPVAAAGSPAGTALRPWREGRNLEEKAQLLTQSASAWVSDGVLAAGRLTCHGLLCATHCACPLG